MMYTVQFEIDSKMSSEELEAFVKNAFHAQNIEHLEVYDNRIKNFSDRESTVEEVLQVAELMDEFYDSEEFLDWEFNISGQNLWGKGDLSDLKSMLSGCSADTEVYVFTLKACMD